MFVVAVFDVTAVVGLIGVTFVAVALFVGVVVVVAAAVVVSSDLSGCESPAADAKGWSAARREPHVQNCKT